MTKIGLLSDTHGYLHSKAFGFFKDVDEIWHAGDIGSMEVIHKLETFKKLRVVYGNIDGHDIRKIYPEISIFQTEAVKVMMTHIGGYPGKYDKKIFPLIKKEAPKLFISGHSHILKVIYDKNNNLLHINPGAAGKFGMHTVLTMIRFAIDGEGIKDLEILEIPRQ